MRWTALPSMPLGGFDMPDDVALDPQGDIYVADESAQEIVEYVPAA